MTTKGLLNKRERTLQWLANHQDNVALQCIHCGERLSVVAQGLSCVNQHRFDMNKQGTFFLAKKSVDDHYDRHLFESRRTVIMATPFYDALLTQLVALIEDTDQCIVDAGAGEGSHLARLLEQLPQRTGIGIDLSKPGTLVASDYNGTQLSIVADLAQLPLGNDSVDVVLSILSPANYQEFHRVLRPSGKVLKVIPNAGYLKEIRQAMVAMGYDALTTYDNQAVQAVFYQHYEQVEAIQVRHIVPMTRQDQSCVVEMTPLTWQLSSKERTLLVSKLPNELTLDMTILIGKQYKK